ncbi:MAG: nucleotidyltransferase domain-containing protein [Thiotrichales bacterium]
MRLTQDQITRIRAIVAEQAGSDAAVSLFGSRLDDRAKGGDIDLLVEIPRPVDAPAPLAARIAGRLSRALDGRNVDVVLAASNLKTLPIHTVARRDGVRL